MERHIFDENQPAGSMSLMNMRNVLRALFQGDLMPLRPRASMVLDDMEYSTDAQAQAKWAGTGVTVSKTTTKQEGNFAAQMVIDATGNRKVSKTQSLNLSAFKRVKIWERCSAASSAFQFYLRDNSGNESYWNLTSNGTANTWQQDDKDLTTPDSNNGANAALASITEWGFLGLDASATYIFDTVRAICGLNVAVEAGLIASFYQQVYVGQSRISFAGGSSPAITLPTTNPRIDLLVMNSSGTLSWITGTEASSPAEPTFPTDKIPLCLIYCKTTMVKVVDYEDKDGNPNEAYILKDVRPFLSLGGSPEILSGLDASKPATYIANRIYWATDTNILYWDNGSSWVDITALFAGFVRLTGDQTIAGIKTFSSIPLLPASDPTTDNQASRKAYVDIKAPIVHNHNASDINAGALAIARGGTGATVVNRGANISIANSTLTTVTFATAFSDTNYSIVGQLTALTGDTTNSYALRCANKTTTTAQFWQTTGIGAYFDYIAIGT